MIYIAIHCIVICLLMNLATRMRFKIKIHSVQKLSSAWFLLLEPRLATDVDGIINYKVTSNENAENERGRGAVRMTLPFRRS